MNGWLILFLAIILPGIIIGSLPTSDMRLTAAGIYFFVSIIVIRIAGGKDFIAWSVGLTIVVLLVASFWSDSLGRGYSEIGDCIEVGRYGEIQCY